jgi:hypothetical protein
MPKNKGSGWTDWSEQASEQVDNYFTTCDEREYQLCHTHYSLFPSLVPNVQMTERSCAERRRRKAAPVSFPGCM